MNQTLRVQFLDSRANGNVFTPHGLRLSLSPLVCKLKARDSEKITTIIDFECISSLPDNFHISRYSNPGTYLNTSVVVSILCLVEV